MPVLDLHCLVCGCESPNTHLPLFTLPVPRLTDGYLVTQDFTRPTCCGQPMANHPPVVAVDAYEPFQKFSTTVEDGRGGQRVEQITSLASLRRVERESAQRHRNGEGRPMVWRDYSQDRSNRDVHTLGPDPSLRPTPRTTANGKAPMTIRRGAAVAATHGGE